MGFSVHHSDRQLLPNGSECPGGHSETNAGSLLISYSLYIYWPPWLSTLSLRTFCKREYDPGELTGLFPVPMVNHETGWPTAN